MSVTVVIDLAVIVIVWTDRVLESMTPDSISSS
jgi:hypothetical protein